jgi:hypothetical protein
MHPSFDSQIQEQSLRLAQGKSEAFLLMKHFWRAKYCQM